MVSNDSEIDKMIKYCKAFRKAIEKCNKNSLPISFRDFPKGSCGDTVPLLGAFLLESGFGEFQYISGIKTKTYKSYSDPITHAWLKNSKGLIIDITADQFVEVSSKVIVSYKSLWHDRFKNLEQHPAHFNIYDFNTKKILGKAYLEIGKLIEL